MAKKQTDVVEGQELKAVTVSGLVTGRSFSLVPKDYAEMKELAHYIAESDLAPAQYKAKPGNCLIAIQMGAEVGISPMQAIQNIAVINGRPSIYGDMGKALLLAHGMRIEERDIKEIQKLGEACCRITRPDGSPPVVRTFSVQDAKTANLWGKQGPWTQHPYRMMAWRAFWFCARDAAADALRGLAGAEEVRDYADTGNGVETVETQITAPTRESAKKDVKDAQIAEQVNKKTGEISEGAEDNTDPVDAPAHFIARAAAFAGVCEGCKEGFGEGDAIWWDPKLKKGFHNSHYVRD